MGKRSCPGSCIAGIDLNTDIKLAVWSEAGGQDDLNWFQMEKQSDAEFLFDIDLSAYDTLGKYYIHIYGVRDGSMTKVAGTTFLRE